MYGRGEVGSVQGCIFSNWKLIDKIPPDAVRLGIGIDFGFTNDPTTAIELWRYNGGIIINQLCYQSGMTNRDIAAMLKANNIPPSTVIVADCAEPKSIAEINQFGYHVQPSVKGADSINFGIGVIQEVDDMSITKDSTDTIKEYRNYVWETDKDGNKTGRAIDAFNHSMDALRYIATTVLARYQQKHSRGVLRRN